jgi:hypothetical protein
MLDSELSSHFSESTSLLDSQLNSTALENIPFGLPFEDSDSLALVPNLNYGWDEVAPCIAVSLPAEVDTGSIFTDSRHIARETAISFDELTDDISTGIVVDGLTGTITQSWLNETTFEANDSLTQATNTLLNANTPDSATFEGEIGDNGGVSAGLDVDMYAVQMNAGDTLTVDVDTVDMYFFPVLDSGLRLFDAAGNELLFNDDQAAPDELAWSADPYLTFTAAAAGNYYIGVSGSGNFEYDPFTSGSGLGEGSTGSYTINFSLATVPPEANDTLTTAMLTGLTTNTPGTVNYTGAIGDNPDFSPALDVDIYTVQLNAGETLIADLDVATDAFLDAGFRLFDALGNEVAFNDNGAASDETISYDPFLAFTAIATGNYFLGVSGFDNFTYDPFIAGSGDGGSTGEYTLTLTLSPDIGDTIPTAYDIGLSSDNPEAMTITSTIGDNPLLSPGLDVDVFSFQLNQGDMVEIDLDFVDSANALDDSVLILFDEQGNELGYSDADSAPDDDGFSWESYIRYMATETGTYYVGVSGYSNTWYDPFTPGSGWEAWSTGDYQLNFVIDTEVEPEAIGDTIPDAYDTGLSSDNPDTFTITSTIGDNLAFAPGLDVDFFSFQLDQGDMVEIDLDFVDSANALDDSVLILFDEQGNELGYSDADSAPDEDGFSWESYIDFIAAETGTYYVGVSGYDNYWYDPFTPGSGWAAWSTGDYELTMSITQSPFDPDSAFSGLYGYGMVDAAAAVAAALGTDAETEVADLGEIYGAWI